MSHVRNLFTNPSGYLREPDAEAADSAQEKLAEITPRPIEPPPSREFPVEQAEIRPDSRLVTHTDPRSPAAERFRFLRMRLRELRTIGNLNRLLIASPLAKDGRSTVLLNLATALADHGRRPVLVLETDLHHPSIARILGLDHWAGLTSCLQNDFPSPFSAIRRIHPFGWCLLPAGETRRNAVDLLQTPAFGSLMETLAPHFDWILLDSPPAIPLTDTLALQHHADATLLVVRVGRTPREAVERTVALLGRKKMYGVVFNGMATRDRMIERVAAPPAESRDVVPAD